MQVLAAKEIHSLKPADVFLITVPDDQIAGVAEEMSCLEFTATAFHTSGALSSDVLEPLRKRGWHTGSIHPLLSVSNAGDFLTRLLESIITTGLAPRSFYAPAVRRRHFDGLPVDVVARSIASVSLAQGGGYATYHVVDAHWSKSSPGNPLVLTGPDGHYIGLAPGSTWIELVPNATGSVTVG